jgi:putative phage-type endonuclease
MSDLPRYGAAIELLPAVATRTAEWHQARAQGITATDVGALLGASSWDTPFSLYWRKKAGLHKVETGQMRTGSRLETTVREMWLDAHTTALGVEQERYPGLIARDDARWQMATCDALIRVGRRWLPLEIKTQGGSWKGWGPDWSDGVPLQYRYQVLWQCHVLGADRGYLACFGPDLTIRTYVIEATAGECIPMLDAAEDFATRLEDETPPELTGAAPDLDVLKQLYPDPAPEKVTELDTEGALLVEAVKYHRFLSNEHGKLAKMQEALLRAQLGDAEVGTAPGGVPIVKRTVTQVPEGPPRKAHQRDTIRILTAGDDTA